LEVDARADLRERLHQVLANAGGKDTEWLYRAIRLAAPGGLGRTERHDVSGAPDAPLRRVMAYAASRDRIAYQYATDYADLFGEAVPLLRRLKARWGDEAWAAAALFMDLLGRVPDTHIARKHGAERARDVSGRALPLARGLANCDQPQTYFGRLSRLDRELKRGGVNPGTSADLTVASLLILRLEPLGSLREFTAIRRRFPGPRAGATGPELHLRH
jgi:triphosphoribosyl-dephospho-CoA synthase